MICRILRHPYPPEGKISIDTNSIDVGYMSILKVSIRQIKAARALIGWSQEQLAKMAGISVPTVKRLEAADGPLGGRPDTATKLQVTLETAGIQFIEENGGGPGVRLRKAQEQGKRK